MYELAMALKASQGKGHVQWDKIPAGRLAKIWLDYGRTGVVRDEKGLDKIADMVLENIARLSASTAMMGHTPEDARETLRDTWELEFTDEEWDDWMPDFFTDAQYGNWMLSDYGLPKLEAIYPKIVKAETAEDKLQWVDRALNVIHQRSDLANMFVQGGSSTLLKISMQGGYRTDKDAPESLCTLPI